MLLNGVDINQSSDATRRTPLISAILNSREEMVIHLINKGADVNSRIIYPTPLQLACEFGNLNIIKSLILYGANIDIADNFNETPIFYALRNAVNHSSDKFYDILKFLIEIGVDIFRVNNRNRNLLHYASKCPGKFLRVI